MFHALLVEIGALTAEKIRDPGGTRDEPTNHKTSKTVIYTLHTWQNYDSCRLI
jgi:hypothetical protein